MPKLVKKNNNKNKIEEANFWLVLHRAGVDLSQKSQATSLLPFFLPFPARGASLWQKPLFPHNPGVTHHHSPPNLFTSLLPFLNPALVEFTISGGERCELRNMN